MLEFDVSLPTGRAVVARLPAAPLPQRLTLIVERLDARSGVNVRYETALGRFRKIVEFRHAATLAKQAGFDGVELHAANGYLPDQFLQDGSNHRTDAYGGLLENRARFLFELIEAIASVWDADQIAARLESMPEKTSSTVTFLTTVRNGCGPAV